VAGKNFRKARIAPALPRRFVGFFQSTHPFSRIAGQSR